MDKLDFNEMNFIIAEAAKILLNEISVKDAYDKHYQNIPFGDYDTIIKSLQGNNLNKLEGETRWALGLYKNNSPRFMEDLYKLHNEDNDGYLDIFKRLVVLRKLNGNEGNLYQYKSISQLGAFINKKVEELGDEEIWGDNTFRKKKNMTDSQKEAKDNIKTLYEDNEWVVITPLSYEASVYWGDGTEWCTAYKDDRSYYDDYAKRGKLFININKATKEKYQFHFESQSFMDKNDEYIPLPVFDTLNMNDSVQSFYKEIVEGSVLINAFYENIWEGYGKKRFVRNEFNKEIEDNTCYIIDEKGNDIAGPFKWVGAYSMINNVVYTHVQLLDNMITVVNLDGKPMTELSFKSQVFYVGNGVIAGRDDDTWHLYKDGELFCKDSFRVVHPITGNNVKVLSVGIAIGEYNYVKLDTGEYLLDKHVAIAGYFNTPESTFVNDTGKYGDYYIIDSDGNQISEKYYYIFRNYHMYHKTLPYCVVDEYSKYTYLTKDGKNAFGKWFCEQPRPVSKAVVEDEERVFQTSYYNDVNYTCVPCEIHYPNKILPIKGDIKEFKEVRTNNGRELIQEINVRDAYSSFYNKIEPDIFNILVKGVQGDNDILLGMTRQMLELFKKSDVDSSSEMITDAVTSFRNKTGSNKPSEMGLMDIWERAILKGVLKGNEKNPAIYNNYIEWKQKVLSFDVNELFLRTPGEWSRAVKKGRDEIEIPYEDTKWKIVIPLTMEAACYWGNNASWCTATRNETRNYFKSYNEDGPLYININKETGERYQFSIAKKEYNDEENEPITRPVLETIGATKGMEEYYKNITGDDWETAFDLLYNNLDEYDYTYIECLEDEVAVITRDNAEKGVTEWNAYSKNNGILSNEWFKWVDYPSNEYRITRVKFFDNSYGILDLEIGTTPVTGYDYINQLERWEDYDEIFTSIVVKNDKQGLLVYSGEQDRIFRPEKWFDTIYPEGYKYYGNYKVKEGNTYGYLTVNGDLLGDDMFDEISEPDGDDNVMVTKDGMVNWMDYEGTFINDDWTPIDEVDFEDDEDDEME